MAKVSHIGLLVTDINLAQELFEMLGFKEFSYANEEVGYHGVFLKDQKGVIVELFHAPSSSTGQENHLCIKVGSIKNTIEKIKELDIAFSIEEKDESLTILRFPTLFKGWALHLTSKEIK